MLQDLAAAEGFAAVRSRPRVLHGMAREVLISNPNEVIAYLSLFLFPVPSAVVRLVRKIEHINIGGRYFYVEFKVVSLERFREVGSHSEISCLSRSSPLGGTSCH